MPPRQGEPRGSGRESGLCKCLALGFSSQPRDNSSRGASVEPQRWQRLESVRFSLFCVPTALLGGWPGEHPVS